MRDPPREGERPAAANGASGAAAPPAPEHRRLEIVHESLLTKWPRLVRWRAQDEEGAVLRDQLRQAARLWEQHGRVEDFLWTGTAFQEFQLWRGRYPGGLTTVEKAFAAAMSALAQRRRRRRRIAVAVAFALLSAVLAVVLVLRQRAVAEALRAEASKLLALGQVELDDSPTAALAYAIRSLELDDSRAARIFALRALGAAPPAFLHTVRVRDDDLVQQIVFSPDGAWAAVLGDENLHVLSRSGARGPRLPPFPSGSGSVSSAFSPDSRHLFAARDGQVRVWGVPGFVLEETQSIGGRNTSVWSAPSGILASTAVDVGPRGTEVSALAVSTTPRRLGSIEAGVPWALDPTASRLAFARDQLLFVRALADREAPPTRVGASRGRPHLQFRPAGQQLVSYDETAREIRLWPARAPTGAPVRAFAAPFEELEALRFDSSGDRLVAIGRTSRGPEANVWEFDAPLDAAPRRLPANFAGFLQGSTFTPDGRWLATAHLHAIAFWPMAQREPRILLGHQSNVGDLDFISDERLVSVDDEGEVREWDLRSGGASRTLARTGQGGIIDVDRRARFLAVARKGGALIVPLDGGESRVLEGFGAAANVLAVAIDAEGRRVAVTSWYGPREEKVIRVWDLETGAVRVLGPTAEAGEGFAGESVGLAFLPDGALLSVGDGGVRRWSLADGTHEVVGQAFEQSRIALFADGSAVAHLVGSRRELPGGSGGRMGSLWLGITNLATKTTAVLRTHGERVNTVAVDATGTIVASGGLDGIVRVGLASGGEPHLLIGHRGYIYGLDISPDGRWIASGASDRTVRIWAMPDLSEPPLHTLPLGELLPRLRSLTNVRVVEESASMLSPWLRTDRGSGYELDVEPFPGWAEVPEW